MFARNLQGRVELRLHDEATAQQCRELGAFIQDCIDRVERTFGRADAWKINITPAAVCFSCDVVACYEDLNAQANGVGFDGAVAGWHAFREIENQLRWQLAAGLTSKVA